MPADFTNPIKYCQYLFLERRGQLLDQVMAVKNVVTQNHRTGLVGHKNAANDERLRQAVGRRLHRVLNAHAPLAAIAQQIIELALRQVAAVDIGDFQLATQREHFRYALPTPHNL